MAFQVLGDTVIDQNQIITSPKLILEGTSASESILSGSLNGDSKLEIKADGSVTFAGTLITGNDISSTTARPPGAKLGYIGGVSSSVPNANSPNFVGYLENTSTETSKILGDGSASFGSGTLTIGSTGWLQTTQEITSDRTGGNVFRGKLDGTVTSAIAADGSATFAGTHKVVAASGAAGGYRHAHTDGGYYLQDDSGNSPVALYPSGRALLAGGDIDLKADGSATFAGTVAVGGLTVGGSSIDTSSQVDSKISTAINAIPATDLSNYDTSTEVTNKINTLLGGAPAALDTLNELAAAIGDDADFASTITGQLSTINTQLSGKADSSSLSNYLRLDQDNTITKSGIFTLSNTDSDWAFKFHNSSGTNNTVYMNHPTHGMHIRNDSSTTNSYLLDVYAANGNRFQVRGADAYTTINGNAVWHAGNDGSGSGLDADKLDGQEGSYYRNASNINAGTFPDRFSNTTRYNIGLIDGNGSNSYDKIRVWDSSSYTIGMHSGQSFGWLNDYAMTFTMNNESDRGFLWRDTSDSSAQGAMSLTTNGNLCVGSVVSVGGQTTRYLREPTGHYGSIQISGSGYGNYEGFSIDGRAVFMHDGSSTTGIYNDVNNEWLFVGVHNSYTAMYHNGSICIKTTGSDSATIGGNTVVHTAGAGLSKSGSTINIDFSSLSSI